MVSLFTRPRFWRSGAVTLGVAALAIAAQPASAQIEEIIVTAQKRAEKLQDVSVAVTALSGDTIRENDIAQFGEIANNTPGLVFNAFSVGQPEIAIRGVSTKEDGAGASDATVVSVDGIYIAARSAQVFDIFGVRVLVPDTTACYAALGVLHSLYKPIPGKFKDYIAIPKANGYQSLHTTLIGPFGTPVEIQIRDADMHHVAESGVASHWLYKDETALDQLQKKTHKWLQSLVELQSTTGDSSEFLEHVKVDLFPGEVYVFSPKGKIFALPRGSTPVDLAYAVHTDIGDRCVAWPGAGEFPANGEQKPLGRLWGADRPRCWQPVPGCPEQPRCRLAGIRNQADSGGQPDAR